MKINVGKVFVAALWAAAPIAGLTLLAVAEPPPSNPVSVPSNTIPAQGSQPTDAKKDAKDKPKDDRPRLERAIHELQETKTYIEKAPHDFGGHRPQALKAVNDAMKSLGEAAKFDLPAGKGDKDKGAKGDAKTKDQDPPKGDQK